MKYRDIAKEYIDDLHDIYHLTKKLVDLKITDKEDIDYLYTSAIVNMCIKFESFTVELYALVFKENNIKFNVPWAYIQYVSAKLHIRNKEEINEAKESWEFYNTIKHTNSVSVKRQLHLMTENNIDTYKEVVMWVYKSLIDLMKLFL